MADPRLQTPSQRKSSLSPLMEAKSKQLEGEKVNACPYGCEVADLDDNGYCDHMVGVSHEAKVGVIMEPLIKDPITGFRRIEGSRPEKTLKGDKFERITVDFRVYRNVPVEKRKPEEE